MLKKILFPTILLLLAYGFWISPDFKEIAAGVAIFLFGMLSLEEGFRVFSGGILERILKRSTDRLYKSIGFGIITTSLMQSSSLVSVLTISFLGAGLIGLAQGIGIIFGANIGTTTGAWLIAGLGLKVKISAYAMPMLVFGVIFIFQKSKTLKGIGYILAGLGFLFLGIHYMKDGFETFKETIDLSAFAVDGYKGLFLFTGIGIFATVVMQSSHATLVLIITALAAGQITYENGLALAIGANIGTTITAILGSMSSNIEGKRLAGAHLIFNLVTGLIAIAAIYPLMTLVDTISHMLHIADDNYTLKLAVFHTIFNLIGVIVMVPFIDKLVRFLERVLKGDAPQSHNEVLTPLYLNDSALEFPATALKATLDESRRLLQNAMRIIAKALGVDAQRLFSEEDIKSVLDSQCCREIASIEQDYTNQLKGIYAQIAAFAIKAQVNMPEEYINGFHNIKLANRNIIEAVKMTQQLQHNLSRYLKSDNPHIKEQYIKMIRRIAKLERRIHLICQTEDRAQALESLQKARKILEKNDIVANGKLDKLIRNDMIGYEMAASLMNDSAYTNNIIKSLIVAAGVLCIDADVDIRLYREEIFQDKEHTHHEKNRS